MINATAIVFSSHVWPGNSGGPVVNRSGQLVGIISGGGAATHLAIAVTELKKLIETITENSVVAVFNRTDDPVNFQIRTDVDGAWSEVTLAPGQNHIWWVESPNVIAIDFNALSESRADDRIHYLEARLVLLGRGVTPAVEQAAVHEFAIVDGSVQLRAVQ